MVLIRLRSGTTHQVGESTQEPAQHAGRAPHHLPEPRRSDHVASSTYPVRDPGACTEDPNLWTSDNDTDRQIALGGCLECPFLAACREQTVDSINRGDIPAGVVQAGIAFDDAGNVDSDAHTVASARELAAQINRPSVVAIRQARREVQEEELPDLSPEEIRQRLAELDAAAELARE